MSSESERRREQQTHEQRVASEVGLWETKGRAAFESDVMRPLGRALTDAGIDAKHPFYGSFIAGWVAALKDYEKDLTPRGRSDFHYRRKLRELVK